jgi:glycosyltransferase involved in cell wall biosynthesis
MTNFYCQSNVALCASKYEGASNSVMEAMASGLAVIATDVGNHREMMESQLQHFGETGIKIVDRTEDAFVSALQEMTPDKVRHMGEINRKEIFDRWSWNVWSSLYTNFWECAL